MKFPPFLLGFVGAALFLGGCTFPMVDYTKSTPSVTACTKSSKPAIAVSGVDIRPDILIKEIYPNYVGSVRDIFAIPYHLNTVHQQTVVSQLVDAVTAGYTNAGYTAQAVTNPNLGSRAAAVSALQKTGDRRFLLVTVHELYSNTLVRTEVNYDVSLEVLNASGHSLARADVQASEKVLNGPSLFPPCSAAHALSKDMAAVLTTLATSPSIKAALK